jgi:carboxyl-terminal processing protease
MRTVLRPFAALGLAGVLLGLGVTELATSTVQHHPGLLAGPHLDHTAGVQLAPYDLAKLKVLEPTLYHVEESYVEPGRVDWEQMYVGGLAAIERRVPAFTFDRSVDAGRVSLAIADYTTVLEVERVGSSRQLQTELRRIAALLQDHLGPDDVEVRDGEDAHSEIEYTLVNGVLDTLDPHSMLLPPEDASEMDVENQGQFGGLGVTIVERDGRLVVDSTMPGTPADRAGLLRADRITRIAGQSTMNMSLDEAVGLLRGPVGAPVTIEIDREAFDEPQPFRIERELIKLNEVAGVLLEGDVGLVRIQTFHRNVESELHDALARMRREASDGRLRGLILDLRDNPGGYLNQAVAVSDTFLEGGEIVSTVDSAGRRRDVKYARRSAKTESPYPMVVLLNANSASASEIVAGALRNNERAVIVGERSFGKGSVQDLHQFYDTSKLKLTISQYLTPGERSIQTVGIPADIELRPVRLDPTSDGEGTVARVYWRERVRREADLDKRLDQSVRSHDFAAETAYAFPYLETATAGRQPEMGTEDYATAFARDLLLSAGHPRRPEMLASAGRVVDQHARAGDAAIIAAFADLGIDWRDGVGGPRGPEVTPPILATLDVGDDGVIDAGVREKITLTVTNISDAPLYRVGALAVDHDVLAGREFVFGHLAPGASRSFDAWVNLVDGYPSHTGELTLSLRDAEATPLGDVVVPVRIAGRPLPDLVWNVAARELEGDGDGQPEVGESIALDVEVHNRGDGLSAAAFVRLKNRSGAAVDLLEAGLEPGTLRLADGSPCDAVDKRAGCQLRLAPDQRWSGTLTLQLKERPSDAWKVDVQVGDDEAYDHASIVAAGLHEHFSQTQRVVFAPGEPLPAPSWSRPPTIRVTHGPAASTERSRVTLSGIAADDTGLRHVMVFADGDKLFFQGEQPGVRQVPFTADATLEPGTNVLSIVAVDEQGFTRTQSVVTERVAPEAVSRAALSAP